MSEKEHYLALVSCVKKVFSEIKTVSGVAEMVGLDCDSSCSFTNQTVEKSCGYSYIKISYSDLKKSKTSFLLGNLNILDIIITDNEVSSFKMDVPLLNEMKEFLKKLKVRVENG